MRMPGRETNLQRELRERRALVDWVRMELHGVLQGRPRDAATTAVAAAAAEETYRVTDRLPDMQNETSRSWRTVLQQVWEFLEGDGSQHYTVSRAVGEFLLGPLNHNEGQDGLDDFDRPQTVAAYSAALSAIAWGVDFAVTAVDQIFEAIDVAYDGEETSDARWAEVQREVEFVHRIVATVVAGSKLRDSRLETDVLISIRF